MADHCAVPCLKFLKECFLLYTRVIKALPSERHSRASLARIRAFAADDTSNAHTGVVLLEKASTDGITTTEDKIEVTEFRLGLPSVAPHGMEFPKCPLCNSASLTSSKQKQDAIKLSCRNINTEGGSEGGGAVKAVQCAYQVTLRKPSFVEELEISEVGNHHYILEFPYPLNRGVQLDMEMAS